MKPTSAERITAAKIQAEAARGRFFSVIGALQHRLKPGNLATQAWTGVKEKGGEIADDAVEAVRHRPVVASGVAAGLLLFLAREPLMSAATRLLNGKEKKSAKRKREKRPANRETTAQSKNEGVSA